MSTGTLEERRAAVKAAILADFIRRYNDAARREAPAQMARAIKDVKLLLQARFGMRSGDAERLVRACLQLHAAEGARELLQGHMMNQRARRALEARP